jgi:hypothetical protein
MKDKEQEGGRKEEEKKAMGFPGLKQRFLWSRRRKKRLMKFAAISSLKILHQLTISLFSAI